jgi:Putative peptidoglycan binding domain
MKMLILATVASAALALPAFAQNQAQPNTAAQPNATSQQTQPMGQPAQSADQTQAGANMQDINPNTLSHEQIQQIQQALDKAGFGAGRTDGIWGPETQAALTNFQKSKNTGGANGQLDSATLSALQLNPDQFGLGQGATANGGTNGANNGMNSATGATNGAANSGTNGGASANGSNGANAGAAAKATP